MKQTEVSVINPEVFEMIPDQHLKEMHRLTKLTGSETTFHAPMLEPSGFTQQGWSEENREATERQLKDVMIRAAKMSPDKPLPLTIHASVIPGTETMPIDMIKDLTPQEKKAFGASGKIPTTLMAVNQETGQIRPLTRETTMHPLRGMNAEIFTPHSRMDSMNETQWTQQLSQLALNKKQADELIRNADMIIEQLAPKISNKEPLNANEARALQIAQSDLAKGQMFLEDVQLSFRTSYEQAAKYGDRRAKPILEQVSKSWIDFAKNSPKLPELQRIHSQSDMLDSSLMLLKKIGNFQEDEKGNVIFKEGKPVKIEAPKMYVPVEEFATKKASETFANAATSAYNELKDKSAVPFISIENPPYGQAISTAEDLQKLIITSRDKFSEKMQRQGMKESEANKLAKKMIGATWDTSHISMMRKQGYGSKELINQAEIIAPYVKHVHLNDNFGYTHTDLPPGMGNVPFKEIMGKLKDAGYKGKAIFEGGNFFQHFKTAPHTMVLEAMGSPLYSMTAQPTWSGIAGMEGVYSTGYGPFLPSTHFSTYGAGFSGLPQELGGQVAGAQSRFSGTPNT